MCKVEKVMFLHVATHEIPGLFHDSECFIDKQNKITNLDWKMHKKIHDIVKYTKSHKIDKPNWTKWGKNIPSYKW